MRRAWHLPKDSDPGHRGWRQTAPLSDRLGRPQRQAAGPWRISRVLRKGAAGARVPRVFIPPPHSPHLRGQTQPSASEGGELGF